MGILGRGRPVAIHGDIGTRCFSSSPCPASESTTAAHFVLRGKQLGSPGSARSRTSPLASCWPTSGTRRVGLASAWQTAPSGLFCRACGRAGRTCLSSSSQTPCFAGTGPVSVSSGAGSPVRAREARTTATWTFRGRWLAHAIQSSTFSSGTRANSPTLLVTTTSRFARAIAAIIRSRSPMGRPFAVRWARMLA